ncbi:hypothetical protein A4X09_0g4435 [Tilletia walkeri]|uniref:Uncharacterized protein n=1 Tax=Tilletia walkeri TaxID=117179 RepID=A0A8X7T4K4_9BASI|nr:hypothetical protein A4X09_0g4435 [Tilletia walkeri]
MDASSKSAWLQRLPSSTQYLAFTRTHPLHNLHRAAPQPSTFLLSHHHGNTNKLASYSSSYRRLLHTSSRAYQQPAGIDSTGIPPPRPTPETSSSNTGTRPPTGPIKPKSGLFGWALGSGSNSNSNSNSGGGSGSSDQPPKGIAFLRRHPVLAGASFVISHLGVAWLLLPPTYFFLHHVAPGGATSMLAGPQTAWALNKHVPDSIATSVPGFSSWAEEHVQGDKATFEDVIEYMARNASIMAWRGARSTINLVQRGQGDKSGESAKKELKREEEIADEAVKSLKGKDDGSANKVTRNALDKFGFSKRAQDAASEIRFAQIRDAISAYVFVKTLLPLRIPLSLWLAPKLGRVFLAAMSKRRAVA